MIRSALQAQRENSAPAVLDIHTPVTFAALANQAASLQAALPNVCDGQIAALLLPDGPDFLSALFAVCLLYTSDAADD